MTKARLELLCHAVDYIEDAHSNFETLSEACFDEIEMSGDVLMDDEKQARLERAENALKSGLRFLEMFKKFA